MDGGRLVLDPLAAQDVADSLDALSVNKKDFVRAVGAGPVGYRLNKSIVARAGRGDKLRIRRA